MLSKSEIELIANVQVFAKEYLKANEENPYKSIDTSKPYEDFLAQMESPEQKLIDSTRKKLYSYLESLSYEEIQFIQTMMYVGRDDELTEGIYFEDLYRNKFNSLTWSEKSIEISQTIKVTLYNYLNSALELAK